MKAIITLASDWEYKKEITISNLEELEQIQDKYNHSLVIYFRDGVIHITVYDDYLE